jgi:hypothetical protein
MTRENAVTRPEYLDKEKVRMDAPRLFLACGKGRLLAFNRGGFSFDGHRLSSLYRGASLAQDRLTDGFDAAFSLPKYSLSTSAIRASAGMERHR